MVCNYHSCLCAFLGMQTLKIGSILVLEGIVFHYIWLKYLFGTITIIYFDILFQHFCLKRNWVWKKNKKQKGRSLFLFWVGRKRANKHFFLGLIEHTSSMKGIVLAHHTLTCDWNNFSMATFPDLKGASVIFSTFSHTFWDFGIKR